MKPRERYQMNVPIEFRMEDARTHKGLLDNIGSGGMCFKSMRYIVEGRNLGIKIPSSGDYLIAEGTVVWCKKHTRRYQVGVKFANELQDTQLQSLG